MWLVPGAFALALAWALTLPISTRATASLEILVFATSATYTGNGIGTTRATSTAHCTSQPAFTTLQCKNASMIVGYSTEPSYNELYLPGTSIPVSATNAVLGPTGVQIAPNWNSFWTYSSWTNTLAAAEVSYYSGGFSGVNYFTGISDYDAYGEQYACYDWTTNSAADIGFVAPDNSLGSFYTGSYAGCSSSLHTLCACVTAFSFPPTNSPTALPSSSPSRSPSQSPVIVSEYYIYIYMLSNIVLANQVSSACPSTSPVATSTQCKWTWPIAATSGWTISNPVVPYANITFSRTRPVLSTSYVQIAANWPTLWSSGAEVSLIAAGVTPGSAGFWTGLNGDGSTASQTCSYWSTTSPTSSGNAGATGVAGTAWIDADGPVTCAANAFLVACACLSPLVPPTHAPTRSPSRAPSRTPTRSPSRSPSRTPSRAPLHPSRSPSLDLCAFEVADFPRHAFDADTVPNHQCVFADATRHFTRGERRNLRFGSSKPAELRRNLDAHRAHRRHRPVLVLRHSSHQHVVLLYNTRIFPRWYEDCC